MIALAQDYLIFETSSGEMVPFSAEMVSIELSGEDAELFDQEFVKHASAAVFHYFRHELGRTTVTVGEFTQALEKVLRGLTLAVTERVMDAAREISDEIGEFDLHKLARDAAETELIFFPRLRDEMRSQLHDMRDTLRFCGLRPCVKQLIGARRWTGRCKSLEEQILAFMCQCLSVESPQLPRSLVVV